MKLATTREEVRDGCRGYDFAADAPLPLSYTAGLRRAAALRKAKPSVYSWGAIAEIMAIYHGISRSPRWWGDRLKAAGMAERDENRGDVQRCYENTHRMVAA